MLIYNIFKWKNIWASIEINSTLSNKPSTPSSKRKTDLRMQGNSNSLYVPFTRLFRISTKWFNLNKYNSKFCKSRQLQLKLQNSLTLRNGQRKSQRCCWTTYYWFEIKGKKLRHNAKWESLFSEKARLKCTTKTSLNCQREQLITFWMPKGV